MSRLPDLDPHTATLGANLVRAVAGMRPPCPANRAHCPWCRAKPGQPCVVRDTDQRLIATPAHHSRYREAGLEPPEVDAELIAERKTPVDWTRARKTTNEPEETA